jgi:hypothetical protein
VKSVVPNQPYAGVPLAAANGWGAKSIGLVQSSFLWWGGCTSYKCS